VSLPRSSGALPVAYDERIEVTRRYVDGEARALFPFGAGLGHTRWSLGAPVASATEVTPDEAGGLSARVSLANEGQRAGTQVVQLYARALLPGIVPRRAILVGFERVRLEAGASAVVTVPVRGDALAGLGLGEVVLDPPGPVIDGLLELWCSIDGPARPDERVAGIQVRLQR
jgi:beta-glucosidase